MGFAVREARDALPKGDGIILQIKEVLAQLGDDVCLDHRRPLEDNLREALGKIPVVVDLLASVVSAKFFYVSGTGSWLADAGEAASVF